MAGIIDINQLDYYIKHLNDKLLLSSRNKAILSFRYENLTENNLYPSFYYFFIYNCYFYGIH